MEPKIEGRDRTAFPVDSNCMGYIIEGLNAREYAAIQLRVPDSGTPWLDDMIRKSLRDEMAGKALQGIVAWTDKGRDINGGPVWAYDYADAIMAAREKKGE